MFCSDTCRHWTSPHEKNQVLVRVCFVPGPEVTVHQMFKFHEKPFGGYGARW